MREQNFRNSIFDELNTIKLVLFVEMSPLTEQQLIKIRAYISKEILGESPPDDKGMTTFLITTNTKNSIYLKDIQESYSEAKIDDERQRGNFI